ncbi:MAG TPA: Smr/MutS family protein [Balneolales bacterium]|nr:Smr/MutS family protein [Balneolales bacterium]
MSGPVQFPIDGTLDLHTFNPRDVKHLVPDYIKECRKHKIIHLRIIHGKGKGILRRKVHKILDKNPYVVDYHLAGIDGGSWGATIVDLKPRE